MYVRNCLTDLIANAFITPKLVAHLLYFNDSTLKRGQIKIVITGP